MDRSLQVRDVPDELHAELRARAAALDLSLSEYVLGLLTDAAGRPPVAEVLRRARSRSGGASTHSLAQWAALAEERLQDPGMAPGPLAADLLSEDRAARSPDASS